MKNLFATLFWIFAICLIAVADYEDEPYYALFGILMFINGILYVKYETFKEFFNETID